MRTIKNRPEKYLRRSDLISRKAHLPEELDRPDYGRKNRDFATAEIDKNFYVMFRAAQRDYKTK
jgi:hypothetical protein